MKTGTVVTLSTIAGVDLIEEEKQFLSPLFTDLAVGTKVYYHPTHFEPHQHENGIVKELRAPDGVWVVYNCAGNWEDYKEYTGCKTNLRDLRMGWYIETQPKETDNARSI